MMHSACKKNLYKSQVSRLIIDIMIYISAELLPFCETTNETDIIFYLFQYHKMEGL